MSNGKTRSPMAGGALLALSILVGAIGGGFLGQPSLGFLVGLGVGLALVLAVWRLGR